MSDPAPTPPPAAGVPWWVPFLFLAVYEVAIIVLVIKGAMAPADFRADSGLVLTAAFGVSIAPPHRKTDQLSVQADDVTVTKTPTPAPAPTRARKRRTPRAK